VWAYATSHHVQGAIRLKYEQFDKEPGHKKARSGREKYISSGSCEIQFKELSHRQVETGSKFIMPG